MGSTQWNTKKWAQHRQTGQRQKGSSQQYFNKLGESRSDSRKLQNAKCDFQIEQQTKVKDTEEKYSSTNVERPNTKQNRNVTDSIGKVTRALKATKHKATNKKKCKQQWSPMHRNNQLESEKIMQDRDKIKEEKEKTKTGK